MNYGPIQQFCRRRPVLILLAVLAMSFVFGCTGRAKPTNANSSSASVARTDNSNAISKTPSSEGNINIREPDRYTVAMTVGAQNIVSDAPASMATLQFSFARVDADRRWGFALPAPLVQVVYLEKSGLRYLVFPGSKQYVEVTPESVGLEIGSALSPVSFPQMQSHPRIERIGAETVNARAAVEYRLKTQGDSATQVEGVVFVDQETGLPLRSEMSKSQSDGRKWRVIVEEREIQLNPDRSQFDVPSGMKKVTQQEAKQQIESFAGALRPFADALSGAPPRATANQPAANKK